MKLDKLIEIVEDSRSDDCKYALLEALQMIASNLSMRIESSGLANQREINQERTLREAIKKLES